MPAISREEQFQRAYRIVEVARQKSRYYGERYKDLGEIRTYEDWLRIPFMTHDALYNHTYPRSLAMLTMPVEGMVVTSTGGSSGFARYGVLTYDEWDAFVRVQAEALKLMGITSTDLVANLFVAGSLWPSFFSLHEVLKEVGAVHLPISANIEIDRILAYILEFKPTVLLSLPTVFVFLADKIIQQKLNVSHVRMIGYAGEHMSENIRKHLRNAFGEDVQIRALAYTSADCGLMGYQCDQCDAKVYHVPTDFQFIEIYNFEEDRICDSGEPGEVVVTNLARVSFPIIRYRVGDLATWQTSPCLCGDRNPTLSLGGRAGDDFKLGGAFISMSTVEKAIAPFVSRDGISANYQLEVEDISENKMRIVLRIESSDIENSKRRVKEIEESMKHRIDEIKVGEDLGYITFEVHFVELGALPRSPITGKVKRLKDKRVEEAQP